MVELTDHQVAHLGMIQSVISRMATNSFALKAVTATIVAATLAISTSSTVASGTIVFLGLLPVIFFWVMDAKYLRLERLYRKLYDHVRLGAGFEQFSMDTSSFDGKVSSTIRIAFSWSVIWFYLTIAIILFLVGLIQVWC